MAIVLIEYSVITYCMVHTIPRTFDNLSGPLKEKEKKERKNKIWTFLASLSPNPSSYKYNTFRSQLS